jgi:hypothetical protein
VHRLSILLVCIAMLGTALPQGASARGPGGPHEAEREQRREELRRQMAQEHQRLRDERGRERPPPRQRPAAPGAVPQAAPDHARGGQGRLSPEERRELRQDLRRQGLPAGERRER